MSFAAEIESALLVALSPESHKHVPDLAKVLIGLADGNFSAEEARARLKAQQGTALIVQELAGKRIGKGESLVSFGYNNQFGNITIGDVAGENIVKVTVEIPRPNVGIPFQAIPLPTYFVAHAERFREIKSGLLGEGESPGTPPIDAVHGMPGSGKSTLASALARDPEVLGRYSDGVLWATLGHDPDDLPLLGGWVQALGDYAFRPLNVAATSSHLQTLLRDKAVLLVVDDAWDAERVRPYAVGGPRCRVLVTTRRAGVVDELGATSYKLDTMSPEESLALLSAKVNRQIVDQERGEALRVAETVGFLPLALDLAGAESPPGGSHGLICAPPWRRKSLG